MSTARSLVQFSAGHTPPPQNFASSTCLSLQPGRCVFAANHEASSSARSPPSAHPQIYHPSHPCLFSLCSPPPRGPVKPALVSCTLRPLASAKRANVRHTYLPLSHYKPARCPISTSTTTIITITTLNHPPSSRTQPHRAHIRHKVPSSRPLRLFVLTAPCLAAYRTTLRYSRPELR